MRVLLQRVAACSVAVGHVTVGSIGPGLCALVGVAPDDSKATAQSLAAQVANLRIFSDSEGKMNKSTIDAGGEVMVVSQFTLLADLTRGRRPYFGQAASPDHARMIIDHMVKGLESQGLTVATGLFGAHMRISIEADGPVTILLDSKR